MMLYILKSSILLVLFLVIYSLLERTTLHTFKRYYLLLAIVTALISPLVYIPLISTPIDVTLIRELDLLVVNQDTQVTQNSSISITTILKGIYIIVVSLLLLKLIYQIYQFSSLSKKATIIYSKGQKFAISDKIQGAFSFYKTIFLSSDISIEWNNPIVIHEYQHVVEKHTLDIIFIHIIKALFWFNPLLYFYQRAIALNHEFLADAAFSKDKSLAKSYVELLLQHSQEANKNDLASCFYFKLTKKRIYMIFNKTNPSKNKGFLALTLALALSLTTLSTLAEPLKKNNSTTTSLQENRTMPVYKGGMEQFNKDFLEKFNSEGLTGSHRVVLKFIVEPDGSMANIEVLKSTDQEASEHALEAMKLMPSNWTPGTLNNEIVSSEFYIPMTMKF